MIKSRARRRSPNVNFPANSSSFGAGTKKAKIRDAECLSSHPQG